MKKIPRKIRPALLLVFFLAMQYTVSAQRENHFWLGAYTYGLDFNSGAPVVVNLPALTPQYPVRHAVVCDRNTGTLLFYSQGFGALGNKLMNRNYTVMPNGSGLAPDGTSLIVPFTNNPDRYYFFTTGGSQLEYSVVDMTLDGGLGDVVAGQKNIPLGNVPVATPFTCIAGNECNFWVLTHERDNRTFRAFEITDAGVSTIPVVSSLPPVSPLGIFDFQPWMYGLMRASSDRRKVLLSMGYSELHDFNPATGKVGNPLFLAPDSTNASCFSGCFSPDDSKLYLINRQSLYQYDLSNSNAAAIRASKVKVSDSITGGYLRTGPDGRIYVPFGYFNTPTGYALTSGNYISCIRKPNLSGIAAEYVPYDLPLPVGVQAVTASPNDVPHLFKDTLTTRTDTMMCPGSSWLLQVTGTSILWEDGSTSASRIITGKGIYRVIYQPNRCRWQMDSFVVTEYTGLDSFTLGPDTTYCQSGIIRLDASFPGVDSYLWQDGSTDSGYTVQKDGIYSVTVTKAGCSRTDSIRIGFASLWFDFGLYPVQCSGDVLRLDPHKAVPGATYTWQDGSHDPVYDVSGPGLYWLTIEKDQCRFSDSVHIGYEPCDCRPAIATAFSPNGDGRNDVFRPRFGCSLVRGYVLNIYDRWGAVIYNSNSNQDGWDGRVKGMPAENGTYFYALQYEDLRGKLYTLRGDVTIVR